LTGQESLNLGFDMPKRFQQGARIREHFNGQKQFQSIVSWCLRKTMKVTEDNKYAKLVFNKTINVKLPGLCGFD